MTAWERKHRMAALEAGKARPRGCEWALYDIERQACMSLTSHPTNLHAFILHRVKLILFSFRYVSSVRCVH